MSLSPAATAADMTASPFSVSVILRTATGRLGFLKEAVQSVLSQHYRPLQLVVVETRSPTDGPAIATRNVAESASTERWLAACPRREGQTIQYLRLETAGACTAGNAGLKAARGQLMMFLNDDQILFERHLPLLVHGLKAHAQCGAAYGVAYEAPTHVQSWSPFSYHEIDRYVVHRQPFSRLLLMRRNFLPLQSVLFRRELLQQCGGLNDRLEGLEDWDLWRRYSEQAPFHFVDEVTSLHRVPLSAAQAAERFRKMSQSQALLDQLSLQTSQTGEGGGAAAGLPFNGPAAPLRDRVGRMLTGNRVLFRFYWHGRRLYHRLRKSG